MPTVSVWVVNPGPPAATDRLATEFGEIVGGLAGTIREDDYCLDFGPHSFFSEDDQILSTALGLFDPPLDAQSRTIKFHFRGAYLDYPLTPPTS